VRGLPEQILDASDEKHRNIAIASPRKEPIQSALSCMTFMAATLSHGYRGFCHEPDAAYARRRSVTRSV